MQNYIPRVDTRASLGSGEEQTAGFGSAAGADRGDRRLVLQLAFATVAPQLHTGLVQEPETMEPSG